MSPDLFDEMDYVKDCPESGTDSGFSSPRSQTPVTPIHRSKTRTGFMQRLFARRGSRTDDEEVEDEEYDCHKSIPQFTLGPNPSIRPLGQKLVARSESFKAPSKSNLRQESTPVTSLSRARQFGESIAASRETNCQAVGSPISEFLCGNNAAGEIETEEQLDQQCSNVCDAIAADAALNRHHIQEWSSYLRSYAEGQFNILSPPAPPPRDPSFVFLPAIYPTNERARLDAIKKCNIRWDVWLAARARDICMEAMSKFNCPRVAISIFDRDHEILLAEKGFDRQLIPRWESIAGHVLMSSNVLVVLNTQKDWRFAGNPSVVGSPMVRFFAGAPMIAPGGEIVGVISLFDEVAWQQFTVFQRRELCDFATAAMTDLTGFSDSVADDERETPILQREDLINGTATYGSSPVPKAKRTRHQQSVFDPNLIPPALKVQKTLSAYSGALGSGDSTDAAPKSTQLKQTRQIVESLEFPLRSSHHTYKDDLETADCVAISESLPSEYFTEDAVEKTDHYQGQPRLDSPILGRGAHLSEPMMSFDSMTGTFTNIEHALVAAQTNIAQAQMSGEDDDDDQGSSRRSSMETLSTDIFTGDRFHADTGAEAKFAAEFWARRLDYDIIYAVEMTPVDDLLTSTQLMQPEAFRLRTLTSYGVEDDVLFDVGIHLQVLRSEGALSWSNTDGQPGDFSRGFLMTMAHERGPLQVRNRGIIFAAFKKIPPSGVQTRGFRTKDIRKLQDAAEVLKRILTKPLPTCVPQRSNTVPPTPTTPFPANEAWELGKYSFDAGTRRMNDYNQLYDHRV